jgi:hypothetical protein
LANRKKKNMSLDLEGQVGPSVLSDGVDAPLRLARSGSIVTDLLHGKFYETNFRNGLFMFGATSTALVNANAVATGVTATAQPIIGVWNPLSSKVNLVISKLILNTTVVANTAVAPGGFVWLGATGQGVITTGSTPISCATLVASGSFAKAFAFATALSGLSGSLTTLRAATISSINAAGPATAITQPTAPTEELVDGSLIVPPGGVLCVMAALATATISMNAGLIWEEVAI